MSDPLDVTLNFRLREDLLAQIDAAAKQVGETRSQFIRRAAVKKAIEIVNSQQCQHEWLVDVFGPDVCRKCQAERANSSDAAPRADTEGVDWEARYNEAVSEIPQMIRRERAEVERLRQALRRHAITNTRGPWKDSRQYHACTECGQSWAADQKELHEEGCLAQTALASVPGVEHE